MKKKLLIYICAVTAILMLLTACGTPRAKDNASAGVKPTASSSASASASASGASDSENPSLGQIDGQTVYYKDFSKWAGIVFNAGIETTDDPKQALDDYMSYKVENLELQAKGYTGLTSDEASAAEKSAADFLTQFEKDNGQTGEQALTEEQALSVLGVTKDEVTEFYKFQSEEAKAKKALVGDQKPTDDQIKNEYNSDVDSDKSSVGDDPTYYTSQVNSGTPVYYVPKGVRIVERILIPISNEDNGAITQLRGQYEDQANQILSGALAKIKDQAQQMYNSVSSGKMTFDAALQQYGKNDNTGIKQFAVVTGSSDMGEEFTKQALALKAVGDISGLFSTDEGYQIIKYTSDKTEGPVSLDEVKDEIVSSLQSSMQDDAWTKLVEQWKTDHKVSCDYNALSGE